MHVGAGRGGYGTTLFDGWMRIQQLLSVMACQSAAAAAMPVSAWRVLRVWSL